MMNEYLNDPNKDFDINKFNKVFDDKKEEEKKRIQEDSEARLRLLNQDVTDKPLYRTTIPDVLIGIKNTWFYILDDLLQQKFTIDTFTKNSRLFYIGITLIFIGIIIYFYGFFSEGINGNSSQGENDFREKIVEKHYIYHGSQPSNVIPTEIVPK